MDESLKKKYGKILMLFYLHRKRKSDRSRKNVLRLLEFKIRNQERLLVMFNDLIRQYMYIYNELNVHEPKRRIRSCRSYERNKGWWNIVNMSYSEERFKQTFRMSRRTFSFVLEKIRAAISKQNTGTGSIPVEERLAITLYKLGRGDYNYTVGEMAGYSESTISYITKEVCQHIVEVLWEECVTTLFPRNEAEFRQALIEMEAEWQFKFAFAAIDGSHLPIKCPSGVSEAMKQYHNFKKFYSVVLLALVDAKYRFIWAALGAPGNTHDSTCFQSTSLWENITNNRVLPQKFQVVDNVHVPPMILGHGAFPMKSWICKPYGDAVLTEENRYFNYRLSRARMVSEGAFGKLKSRFRVLHRKCESSKESVKAMSLAALVLHNICLSTGDSLPRSIGLTVDPATNKRRDIAEIASILDLTDRCQKNYIMDSSSRSIREALTNLFWEEKNSFLENE